MFFLLLSLHGDVRTLCVSNQQEPRGVWFARKHRCCAPHQRRRDPKTEDRKFLSDIIHSHPRPWYSGLPQQCASAMLWPKSTLKPWVVIMHYQRLHGPWEILPKIFVDFTLQYPILAREQVLEAVPHGEEAELGFWSQECQAWSLTPILQPRAVPLSHHV